MTPTIRECINLGYAFIDWANSTRLNVVAALAMGFCFLMGLWVGRWPRR